MNLRILVWAFVASCAVQQSAPAQSSQSPPRTEVHVDVIGATPLPGIELRLEDIPAPVQAATDQEILRSGSLDLADFLNRRMNGVYVNDVQGNPFQPDINYRGYVASPLLGTPQGLSVFMDGVRLNQPFGDVVSWDLIPRVAISSTILMPGSNPLFGLNTLGGAIAIQTKSGRSSPGTTAQATIGSALRRALEVESGGASGSIDWYVAGNLFADDGWRDRSPSGVRQLFAKVGWQNAKTELTMSGAYADTSLTGNGLQDFRFLNESYSSVYTSPDTTDNRSFMLNAGVKRSPRSGVLYSGNAYYRGIHSATFNGDINEGSLDQSLYQPNAAEQAALAAAGYTGFPTSGENASNTPFPSWRCIANALLHDDPAQKCNGLLNSTDTVQQNGGVSGQITLAGRRARIGHQFTAGAALDASSVTFGQSAELGYLNADRTVTGVGAFGDGVTGGTVDGKPYDTRVSLDSRILTWSLY
ncbi:MAG TPA: TonB-dependent receptor plug domain-containing protein, partial [Vicinamibacterales bacterium]